MCSEDLSLDVGPEDSLGDAYIFERLNAHFHGRSIRRSLLKVRVGRCCWIRGWRQGVVKRVHRLAVEGSDKVVLLRLLLSGGVGCFLPEAFNLLRFTFLTAFYSVGLILQRGEVFLRRSWFLSKLRFQVDTVCRA